MPTRTRQVHVLLRPERGVALVAVLWVLTLIAMVAAGHTVAARTGLALARNLEAAARAEALADAGVQRAIAGLFENRLSGGPEAYLQEVIEQSQAASAAAGAPAGVEGGAGSIADLLEDRPGLEQELAELIGEESEVEGWPIPPGEWPLDGTAVPWTPAGFAAGAAALLSIQDEGGRIDLNAAADELLIGLFTSAGLAEEEARALTDAVRDYADADDLARASGAEAPAYRAAGLSWAPKNARFQAPQEVLGVLGMTPALYVRIAPALTVWNGSKGIDPYVAPPEALAALPAGNEAEIEQLLAGRAAGAVRPAGLVGVGDVTARARGRVFRIRAEARTAEGANFVREAVVRLGGGAGRPFAVMWWGRGARATDANEEASPEGPAR